MRWNMSKPFDDVTFKGLHMCQGNISGHQCVACSLHHGVFQLSTGEVWPQQRVFRSALCRCWCCIIWLEGTLTSKIACWRKIPQFPVKQDWPTFRVAMYSQAQGVPSRHAGQVASTRESLWWNVLHTPPQGYLGESLFLCPPYGCSSHSDPWTDSQKDDGGGPQLWKSSWRKIYVSWFTLFCMEGLRSYDHKMISGDWVWWTDILCENISDIKYLHLIFVISCNSCITIKWTLHSYILWLSYIGIHCICIICCDCSVLHILDVPNSSRWMLNLVMSGCTTSCKMLASARLAIMHSSRWIVWLSNDWLIQFMDLTTCSQMKWSRW